MREREREWKRCVCVCVCVGRALNNYINFVQCSARQVRFPQLIDIILNSFTLINDIIPSDRSERGTAGGWDRSSSAMSRTSRVWEREAEWRSETAEKTTDRRTWHTHVALNLTQFPQPQPPQPSPSPPPKSSSACSCSSSSRRAVEFHYKLKNCSFLFENTLLILQLPWIVLIR